MFNRLKITLLGGLLSYGLLGADHRLNEEYFTWIEHIAADAKQENRNMDTAGLLDVHINSSGLPVFRIQSSSNQYFTEETKSFKSSPLLSVFLNGIYAGKGAYFVDNKYTVNIYDHDTFFDYLMKNFPMNPSSEEVYIEALEEWFNFPRYPVRFFKPNNYFITLKDK